MNKKWTQKFASFFPPFDGTYETDGTVILSESKFGDLFEQFEKERQQLQIKKSGDYDLDALVAGIWGTSSG